MRRPGQVYSPLSFRRSRRYSGCTAAQWFRALRSAGKHAVPRRGPKEVSFLRKRNPLWEPKEKLDPIGRVPPPIDRRASGYRRSTHRPLPLPFRLKKYQHSYGRLLPCLLGASRPRRWLGAIETTQGSGSGKRGFACSQTARRSSESRTIASKLLSFGSNPFSFRKENGFAPAGRPAPAQHQILGQGGEERGQQESQDRH